MLKQAFVLINAEIGAENEVLKSLKSIPEVRKAYRVSGSYDIVARVEAENPHQLKDIFIDRSTDVIAFGIHYYMWLLARAHRRGEDQDG